MNTVGNLEEAPLLVAQTGPLKGQRWSLGKPLLIGREATCDVVVPDRMVSRFHARITPTPEGMQLEDLGSKNGTHCNGNPVAERMILKDGDTLQIALSQQFVYLTSDATMPLAEVETGVGRLRLDLRSRRVWVNGISVAPPLSVLQFHVLHVLYERQGQVVPREELVSASWGDEQAVGVSDQALDALLRRLRDRIAEIDPSHSYIVTVRGHGIRLDNPKME
ncbi:MAG: FHA domain-containing protein [Chloroflexota bacterium]